MSLTKTTPEEAKTSIWQTSWATWIGTQEQLEARAQQAKEWLEQNIPDWIDDWSLREMGDPHHEDPDLVIVRIEFGFDFLTELDHGKHNWRETADQDPKLIAMRELIDRLSNHLDLVSHERFNPRTTGAVYEM